MLRMFLAIPYEQGDPVASFPLWKDIRLEEFHKKLGFDLDSFVAAIVEGFRALMEVEQMIEHTFQSLPNKPSPRPSVATTKSIFC